MTKVKLLILMATQCRYFCVFGKLVRNELLVEGTTYRITEPRNSVCIGWFLVEPVGCMYRVVDFVKLQNQELYSLYGSGG